MTSKPAKNETGSRPSRSDTPALGTLRRSLWSRANTRRKPFVRWDDYDRAFVTPPDDGVEREILFADDVKEKREAIVRVWKESATPTSGVQRLYHLVLRKYIGVTREDVADFLETQEARQIFGRVPGVRHVKPTIARGPAVTWFMDHMVLPQSGSKTCLFAITDAFSKTIWARAQNGQSSAEVKACLTDWLRWLDEQKPGLSKQVRVIRHDRGAAFTSEDLRAWAADVGIKLVPGTAYVPQSQGMIERGNATLRENLMSLARTKWKSEKAWPKCVDQVVDSLNRSWRRVIGRAPIEALTSDADAVVKDVKARIEREAGKRRLSALYKDTLNPGSYVRVSKRADGTAAERASYKDRTRKFGEANWSKEIYTVRRKTPRGYMLVERPGLYWDRADLQKLPGDEALEWESQRPAKAARTD